MKQFEELLWKAFTKNGEAGYYMLYNALNDSAEKERKK